MKTVYALLTLIGTIVPYYHFSRWVTASDWANQGYALSYLFAEMMPNPLSTFAWTDLTIAGVAWLIFIVVDSRRHHVRHAWLGILGTCFGLSVGVPLYLYLRQDNQAKC